MRIRYEVKSMRDGRHGVYDWERGSFPMATPDLRKAGFESIDWFTDKAEAEAVAKVLNGGVDPIAQPVEADDDLAVMAAALIGSDSK